MLPLYGLKFPPRLLDTATLSDDMEPFQQRESDVSNNQSSSFTSVQTFSNINGQTKQSNKTNQQTMSKDENNNTLIEQKMQKSMHENGKVVLDKSMHYQLGTGANQKPFIKILNEDGDEFEMRYLKESSPEKKGKEALSFVQQARPAEKKRRIVSNEQKTASAAAGKELMTISEYMNRYFDEPNTFNKSSVSQHVVKSTAKSKTTTKKSTAKKSSKSKPSVSQHVVKSTAKSKTTTKKSTAKKSAKSKPSSNHSVVKSATKRKK